MARRRTRSRLGEAIYQTRQEAQLSQEQLGDAVGVPQPRISGWEREAHQEVEDALDLLARISTACGRPPDHVLRRAGWVSEAGGIDLLSAIDQADDIDDIDRDMLRHLYTRARTRPEVATLSEHRPLPSGSSEIVDPRDINPETMVRNRADPEEMELWDMKQFYMDDGLPEDEAEADAKKLVIAYRCNRYRLPAAGESDTAS